MNKKDIKTIAVIGPNGNPAVTGGGGSSYVDSQYPLSLYDAVQKIAGNKIDVVYETGVFTGLKFPKEMFDNFDFYVYDENGEKVKGVNANYYLGKN